MSKRIKVFSNSFKYIRKKMNCDELNTILLPSFLGICICTVCLVGSTFAWFSTSKTVPSLNIQSAHYDVTVVVKVISEIEGESVEIVKKNGTYTLEKDKTYSVTLTAFGDASTGYCIIGLGENEIHTVQFPAPDYTEKSISFELIINQAVDMKILTQWGSSSCNAEDRIGNNCQYTYREKIEDITTFPNVSEETEPSISIESEEVDMQMEVTETENTSTESVAPIQPETPIDESLSDEEPSEQSVDGTETTTQPDVSEKEVIDETEGIQISEDVEDMEEQATIEVEKDTEGEATIETEEDTGGEAIIETEEDIEGEETTEEEKGLDIEEITIPVDVSCNSSILSSENTEDEVGQMQESLEELQEES